VDVMIAVGSNFFYTVTLECTLWFFDKVKAVSERKDKVLFIDARHLFRQVDRAHRDFTEEQIEFVANIARLYRGERPEFGNRSKPMLKEKFPTLKYQDVAGLCRVATIKNVEARGWSLNPGQYVGVTERPAEEFDFYQRLEEMNEELKTLNAEAHGLEERIAENAARLLKRAELTR
jgi:type I restriction enzyme M protein